MLAFRSGSWHARLYRRAYADDREWLDHPISGREWHEKSAEKAAVVRTRLDGGLMSICPYFWKTLYALLVYCFVAVPWYATRNFLRANWRTVLVVLAAQAAIAALLGVWWVRGDIAALPGKVVEWNQVRIAKAAEESAALAEIVAKHEKKQAYLRSHPEEAARKKAIDEAWEKEWRERYEAKEAARDAKAWAEMKSAFAKAAPYLIGGAAAITLIFTFTPLFELLLAAFVLLIMIPLERTRWGRALLEVWAACVWWFMELPGRIWRATKAFLRDTWQFLRGYVMAVKERVCPFITFVDGHPTH